MSPHAIAETTWKLTNGGAEPTLVIRNRFARRQAAKAIHLNLIDPGLRLVPETLPEPLGWRRSQHILVDVGSDLFHPQVPLAYQDLVWRTMALARWHTFLFITRNAAVQRTSAALFNRQPLPNVWLGVRVENRAQMRNCLEELRNTPAAVRFLSVDPLLEDLGPLELEGLDWVILGGQGHPRARPLEPAWVRSIRDQCLVSDVPFFFKHWGGCPAARVLDGRLWNERPSMVHATPPPLVQRRRLQREIHRAIHRTIASLDPAKSQPGAPQPGAQP